MAALPWVSLLALCAAQMALPAPAEARMAGPMGHAAVERHNNPLMDDPPRGHHKANSRAAECVFGKQTRELGSTWFADLGPPFGVMYCIRCECTPIQKKRRIVARVQCRNIKHECPEPTCDEPVLLPNRCCKVCPGDSDIHSPDIVQDVAPTVSTEEEDKNWKHFAALLTGRTSRILAHAALGSGGSGLVAPPRNTGNHVATARFTFHRKSLYYSVLTPRRPRAIQFVDREGSILEEQAISPLGSAYQNATGKVCGVWRRLSRDYRRLLREERLLVTLVWDNEDSVTGGVQRSRSLGSELLSALLLPQGAVASTPGEQHPLAGAGGTAIVSISSSGPAPSVHLALLFNGIFSPQDTLDVPVSVRLETADGSRQVLEETVRIAKPGAEMNEATVTAAVSSADLRLLTRGKLVLTVSSAAPRRPRDLALAGAVQPRAVCEVFQAPLSVAEAAAEQQEDVAGGGQQTASVGVLAEDKERPAGQAWLYVDRHGALVYSVQLSQLPAETTLLALVSGRGRRSVELEDLTPSLHASLHAVASHAGWANGSVSRLSPRELEQLYAGELAVNVATGTAASLVRGRLVARPVADARDSPQPILLTPKQGPTGSSVRIPVRGAAGNMTGMAWFAIDQDCNLNYDLTLSAGSPVGASSSPLQLALEQVPFLAPGAPVSRRVLDEFSFVSAATQHEAGGIALSHAELSRLDAGVSYVDVVLPDGGAELRGELRQVRVPAFCLPHYSDNDVPSMSASMGQPSGSGEPEPLHCFHETRFFEDGAQWVSSQDACTMCSCHRARVQCDAVVCPPLRCDSPAAPAPGQCCGHCAAAAAAAAPPAESAAPAGCKLGTQFHAAGTTWHPYVPPNGFDTCAVCTCNASTLETRCERTQCPPLACAEHEAVRADPRACCKKCPAPKTAVSVPPAADGDTPPPLQAEQAAPKTMEEVLAEGGCKNPLGKPHLNGDEWHPRISSHGEYKCVTCRCKDGKVKCDRKRCTRTVCESQAQAQHSTASAASTSALGHQALRRSSALHAHAHGHGLGLGHGAPREEACCVQQCRRFRRHHNKPKNEPRNEPRR